MKHKLFAVITAVVVIVAVVCAFVLFRYPAPVSVSVTGMGTLISVKRYGGTEEDTLALLELFTSLEQTCSLSIENSAVRALNQKGTTSDPVLVEQISSAAEVSRKSNGAFDLTVGGLTALWHIGFDDACKPDEAALQQEKQNVGWQRVQCGQKTVTLGEGQSIDLGAVTKGYACDRALAYLQNTGCRGAVVSVGGSLLFYGSPGRGKQWTVGVKDPFGTQELAGTFSFAGGFVSTSGGYERFLMLDGKKYPHILDPSTGCPAESDLASATVIASTGFLSDALSTACFVLGSEKAEALLREYNAAGILIKTDGTTYLCGNTSFTPAYEGIKVKE